MKAAILIAALFSFSFQTSPSAQQSAGSAASATANATNIAAIRAAEAAMMAAGEEKGAAGYMSFYAPDAVELPNGAPTLEGKENIASTMAFLDDKNNRLTWTPVHVDVSASGDLAYTYGNYEFRSIAKDGKVAVEQGKYATVWKKQKDGQWKVVLDVGNANSPAK